jgi:hypothetical protein
MTATAGGESVEMVWMRDAGMRDGQQHACRPESGTVNIQQQSSFPVD